MRRACRASRASRCSIRGVLCEGPAPLLVLTSFTHAPRHPHPRSHRSRMGKGGNAIPTYYDATRPGAAWGLDDDIMACAPEKPTFCASVTTTVKSLMPGQNVSQISCVPPAQCVGSLFPFSSAARV